MVERLVHTEEVTGSNPVSRTVKGAPGPIKLQSRIDVPRAEDPVGTGDVVIAGMAWQPHTGIAKVQVEPAPVTPDGATGWHSINVLVRA